VDPASSPGLTRRQFVSRLATYSAAATLAPSLLSQSASTHNASWFERTLRWGQTNLTEIDPLRFDLNWWRQHWRRTRVQGVVLNAGGIVAYYPTQVPFHRRAEHLGERDFLGDLVAAARDEGLAVFARMDSHRADQAFYDAHPDWFAHDAHGQPYKVTDLYVACVNSPYYHQHIPAVLAEVAERYRPDGFTDNNWNGPMRHQPCYCRHCADSFRARTGEALPRTVDWDSPIYREWIMWNYARRLEIWDHFNQVTRTHGGPHCLWVGMMAGSQNWQSRVFRDDREVYRRSEIIMLDHQRRFDHEGFQHNAETGLRLRSVGGWDKVIPESMAMYHLTEHNFRLAAKPEPEARLWAVSGFAGGIQPWWHHVGSEQHDLRMLRTAVPLWQWHAENEAYLVNRRPVAVAGLLWSQRNMDFFGRDDGSAHVDDPWNGWSQALIRARIPYVPLHVDDIERVAEELDLKLLILPNLAALSDEQVDALRRFVQRGGGLIATGLSSLCNEWGETRPDFALSDVFGVSLPDQHPWRDHPTRTGWAANWTQTYLRLSPEQRRRFDGPRTGGEAAPVGERHPVLRGFDETDLLAFGGRLAPLTLAPDTIVPLTFVPPVPVAPAESVWMRTPHTDIPGLVLREHSRGSGRVAYLPADIDRRFSTDHLPDHAQLLDNLVRWVHDQPLPLEVEGVGLITAHLYRQDQRLILHLVNLTNAGTWRTPVHELIPLGPFRVRFTDRLLTRAPTVRSLVTGDAIAAHFEAGQLSFDLPRLVDHDVLVTSA
jgi:hypothetical protein